MEKGILIVLCFVIVKENQAIDFFKNGQPDFKELAQNYGHKAVEYAVTTKDGYVVKLFRIPGTSNVPVLIMHGIFDTADTWVLRGNSSLAIALANRGHDVWVGNWRGNKYGRKHIYLDHKSEQFWDFSFHENGYYDLPAIIDTVLFTSKSNKLNAIAHSQGTTAFFVLGSTKPQYNDKVNVLVALAPVSYLQNVPPPLKNIIEIAPQLNELANYVNVYEIFGPLSPSTGIIQKLCPKPIIGYVVCVLGVLMPIAGNDIEELEKEFTSTLFRHFPSSGSRKNLYHYAQVSMRRTFAQYDYGEQINLAVYQTSEPPEYQLGEVTMRVSLHVGAGDKLATVEDAAILSQKLPNVQYHLLPRRKMAHFDFLWGKHMDEYLFPYIFDTLRSEQ